MTPTLESALSGLPAKPRVHELSKRIGISNKELLAALADRGLTIKSASASVPQAVAQELIEALLGGEHAPEGAGGATEVQIPVEVDAVEPTRDAVAGPDAEPEPDAEAGPPADTFNPLFLPPAEQQSTGPADSEPAPAESDGAPPRSRRRRGRQAGRRPADDAPIELTDTTDGAETPGQGVVAGDQSAGEDAPTAVGGTAEGEPAEDDTAESAATSDTDEDSSARGRRRRRGRRGRGRVSDERSETGSGDAVADDESDAESPTGQLEFTETPANAVEGPVADGDAARDAETDTESDAEGDTDSEDAGQGGSAGARRRRRRRRRSTGDEAPREDDPDNTVVHVREPRLSQTSASVAPTGQANEVQGVRGSTRLEAKRQRRRDSRDSSRRRPQILTEAEFLARRESVERVMAVRQRGDLAQVALLEDGILVEHFVSQTGSDSMIGSVFLGKVQNVLPSMEAAFVDIGRGRNAVIYAGEVNWDAAGLNGKARRIETALSSGDTILAQVSKDPVGHKGARLTTQISLPGRFVVYVPGGGATGISRKLPDTERKRLKSIMDRIVPEDAGVIIRTAAEGIAEDELARDVERLKLQWDEITRRASEKTSAPTQLYAEPGTLIKVVRDLFNSDITRLVVDGDEAYGPVADYVNSVAPELADRLVRYETGTPNGPDVFAAYRIDEQILKALERKVHLPSGGSLVIDRTEAMTVVDVNTGKYTGSGGNLEETVTKNNLEAAEEMVRQLRLRDIGGIIVIDFIDMVLESNRELVLRRLTEALGRDRTRHQVAEVTSLGLVQMTRKRMGTGLVEAFSEPCPHCGGRGIVLHDLPMVATAIEETTAERRSGKTRRGRGRDTDRVEEFVPRVVEVPAGRRPDPRGPKPPPIGAADNGSNGASGRAGTGREQQPALGTPDADEIDWIEAAASAGIQAAEDADEDGFEAGQPGSAELSDDVVEPVEIEEIVVEVDDSRAADTSATEPPVEPFAAEEGPGGEATAGDEPADVAAEAIVPVPDSAPPAREPRRRGRRSAGRPAGAPPAAQPVDIIVREPAPEVGSDTNGAVHDQQSPNGYSAPEGGIGNRDARHSAGDGDRHSGDQRDGNQHDGNQQDGDQRGINQSTLDERGNDQNGGDAISSGPDGESVAASLTPRAAPPRRRRAASRPAGPAAGPAGGEPVIVVVPAETPTEQSVS